MLITTPGKFIDHTVSVAQIVTFATRKKPRGKLFHGARTLRQSGLFPLYGTRNLVGFLFFIGTLKGLGLLSGKDTHSTLGILCLKGTPKTQGLLLLIGTLANTGFLLPVDKLPLPRFAAPVWRVCSSWISIHL
jgi:hypothetical protein